MMTRKIGLAVAVASIVAVVSAQAGQTFYVTNSASTAYKPIGDFNPGPVSLNVDQFYAGPYDVLQKVKVMFTGSEQANVKGENGDSSAGTFHAELGGGVAVENADFSLNVLLNYSSGDIAVSANEGIAAGGAKAYNGSGSDFHDFGLQTAQNSQNSSWLYTADMADASIYSGSGTWALNASGFGVWGISGTGDANTDVSNSGAQAAVKVIYAYTELIPEPGSVVLIGAGCCALYFRRRFQKLTKKA